jgi:hypothetical protein
VMATKDMLRMAYLIGMARDEAKIARLWKLLSASEQKQVLDALHDA